MPYTVPIFSPTTGDVLDEVEIPELSDDGMVEEESDDSEPDSEEDEEEEEQEQEEDEEYVPIARANSRISPNTRLNPARRIVFEDEAGGEQAEVRHPTPQESTIQINEGRRDQCEVSTSSSSKRTECGGEVEGVCCPICMESWSSEGHHQVCCLPCGHVYGFSCIEKWIRQCKRGSAKCPQCSRKCGVKDIIKLYVSRISVVDGEHQKKVLSLQAENEFLKMKIASLNEKIRQDEKERVCKEGASCLENISSGEMQSRTSEFVAGAGDSQGQELSGHTSVYGGQGSCCRFELEDELAVDGARMFDIDAYNKILILARRLPGMAGNHVLTKISLLYPYDSENIHLPLNTKAVKDLHVSPSAGKLALFATLGKKLSILSMESNNLVLTYDLPGPAWSCAWDLNNPNHVYAGLQNGMLLVFDMRQTAMPLESINGLTYHPIHTIHSLGHNPSAPSDARTVLSASSIGPCLWTTGNSQVRPFLVPELENQGVCISLAHSPSTNDMVATFRPKIQTPNDIISSQLPFPSSPTIPGRGTIGSHIHIKKIGPNCYQNLGSSSANVSDVRMSKSAIVNVDGFNPLLAYGDELNRGLSLRGLPSLRMMQILSPLQNPILDVKYEASLGSGVLGCVSEDRLQLYSAKR